MTIFRHIVTLAWVVGATLCGLSLGLLASLGVGLYAFWVVSLLGLGQEAGMAAILLCFVVVPLGAGIGCGVQAYRSRR